MYETIKTNLRRIQEETAPWKSKIIAVTKYFGEDAIIAGYEAGLRDFGESRVIEACEKIEKLPSYIKENSLFHFIGHLQTNKVKQAVKFFDYIHSTDSLKLAQSISNHASSINKVQKIFVQINNAREEQKFGFSPEEIIEVFGQIQKMQGLEIVGVMNMAPIDADENRLRELFLDVVQIRNTLEEKYNCKLKEISMGMSRDYKIAAQSGATMIRIGRKLFEQ